MWNINRDEEGHFTIKKGQGYQEDKPKSVGT